MEAGEEAAEVVRPRGMLEPAPVNTVDKDKWLLTALQPGRKTPCPFFFLFFSACSCFLSLPCHNQQKNKKTHCHKHTLRPVCLAVSTSRSSVGGEI